jgi:SAM-dependent methyltransferase
VLRRFQCTFLPWSVRRPWRTNPTDYWERYPTDHFRDLGGASRALLDEIMEVMPARDAAILDMGCNAGRHLDYLFTQGYRNLAGVDFSGAAIREMANRYPEMHRHSRLVVSSFEDFLPTVPAATFDLVYTRGATFEIVHPRFALIRHVCRISKKFVVLVISEFGHAYPRFWEYEFARAGFELTHLRRPASTANPEHKVTLLTFRRLA